MHNTANSYSPTIPSSVALLTPPRRQRPLHIAAATVLLLLLVLPAAFLNQYFTLDVGGILAIGSRFPENAHQLLSPFNGSGRYYPLYWLYHVGLYSLFGSHVAGYYLVQCLGFLCGTLLLTAVMAKATTARVAAIFCVLLFLSSPNAEILYTMGKAEPLLYLFSSAFLFLSYRISSFSIGRYLALGVLFTAGVWCKETGIVLLPFAITGILIGHVAGRLYAPSDGAAPALRRHYLRLFVSVVIGVILSLTPYLIFLHDGGNTARTYMTYDLTVGLLIENVLFYAAQQPDVFGFGILATVLIASAFQWLRRKAPEALTPELLRDLTFAASVLAMAWSYIGILLVFRWGMGYYAFVPSILFRFAAIYGAFLFYQYRFPSKNRRLLVSGAFVALTLCAVPYLWYVASSQVRYSRIYSRALQEYLSLSRKGDRMLLESFPFYSEQVGNTKALLSSVFYKERQVHGIADVVDPAIVTPEMRALLAVSDKAVAENEKNIPQKGDYVVSVTGNELATWQVRGVSPFFSEGSVLARDGGYEMAVLADRRMYCPEMFVHVWTHRPAIQSTYIGYKIYKVLDGPRFNWFGKFPDGWMGNQARLVMYPRKTTKAIINISTSKYNPRNNLAIYRNDVLLEKTTLTEGNWHAVRLEGSNDAPTVFRFEVERTFVPKKLHLGNDPRPLGALIRLESLTR